MFRKSSAKRETKQTNHQSATSATCTSVNRPCISPHPRPCKEPPGRPASTWPRCSRIREATRVPRTSEGDCSSSVLVPSVKTAASLVFAAWLTNALCGSQPASAYAMWCFSCGACAVLQVCGTKTCTISQTLFYFQSKTSAFCFEGSFSCWHFRNSFIHKETWNPRVTGMSEQDAGIVAIPFPTLSVIWIVWSWLFQRNTKKTELH